MLSRLKFQIVLVSVLCFMSAACGFHPLYGKHSALTENNPLAGNTVVETIAGYDTSAAHESQILKNAIEDKLNPESIKTVEPEYKLHIVLNKVLIPAVIKSDGTIERYNVQFHSTFQVIHVADNKVLLASTIVRTGSYNVAINGNFATYEAQQDAIARTLQEMAEDYLLRLSNYFAAPEKNENK